MSLSPAAAAVWNAYNDVMERVGVFEDCGDAIAAALRAAADQVVPEKSIAHTIEDMIEQRIRRQFFAIAAELEGGPQTISGTH
ncbi:MAG: hypothetical protein EBT27_03730 [Betaproteobacteria bacterium]|nr:hypothetical protein [Betaproteobacteria bacterium]